MWEYEIIFKSNDERRIITGYSFADACSRNGLNIWLVDVLTSEFVD